jgi:hypothetical protein
MIHEPCRLKQSFPSVVAPEMPTRLLIVDDDVELTGVGEAPGSRRDSAATVQRIRPLHPTSMQEIFANHCAPD